MSNALHELIYSLTKNEKGYFTKQVSKGDSSYGKLFKIIASQRTYNEEIVRNEFKGTYIGNHFSFAKNYLYHAILKSLIQYQPSKKNIYFYFSSEKILYEKGLYHHCAKLLKQILKKTEKNNDYLSMLKVIQSAKLLSMTNADNDKILEELVSKESLIIEKHQIVSKYQSFLAQTKRIIISRGASKESESIDRINSIKNHLFFKDKSKCIDKYCEQMFHETLFQCGFLLQDDKLIRKHVEPLQNLLKDPSYSEYMNGYRKTYVFKQLIRFNLLSSDFEAAENNINALKDLLKTSTDINRTEKVASYAYLYTYETDLLLNQKKFDGAKELFAEIDLFVVKNRKTIPDEFFVVITGNILVARFMMADYKEVARLANEILSDKKLIVRKDIVISVMLAETIVFYEMDKIDLFESRLNAFKRYLVQHKVKEVTWDLFSNFLNKLLLGNEIGILAKELIVKLEKSPSDRIVSDLDFVIDWLRKK
jgi:hypothetical protein